MNDSQNIPEVGPQIPRNAVSIYGQGDAMDDFEGTYDPATGTLTFESYYAGMLFHVILNK